LGFLDFFEILENLGFVGGGGVCPCLRILTLVALGSILEEFSS